VAYFKTVHDAVEPDYLRRRRIEELDERENPSDAEVSELEALEEGEALNPFYWETLFDRAERCVANWCVANPEFVDRQGRPVEEGGACRVEQIVERPLLSHASSKT
jgi:hypothetical protein